MSMKYLVLVLVYLACVSAKIELPADLLKYITDLHENCIQKTGISEEDHTNYVITNKDPKMMCYMKCLMLESHWMTADGVIQYDYIVENAPPSVAHLLVPAVKKCRELEEGTHECEKAYNFHACMCKVEPDNWFLV